MQRNTYGHDTRTISQVHMNNCDLSPERNTMLDTHMELLEKINK